MNVVESVDESTFQYLTNLIGSDPSGIVDILRFTFNWCITVYMLYKILDLLFAHVIPSPTKDDVKIYAKPTTQNTYLRKNCPSLKRGYHYPLWAINGHLQTLYATIGREYNAPASSDVYQREQILASDGGTIVLDWHESKTPIIPDITIVIVPGIASSSEACAIRHFVKRCTESTKVKLRVIVYNHRGCTDVAITTPRLFTYAGTEDFHEALQHIQKKTKSPMIGVGFSMGGNMLGKYLGKHPNQLLMAGIAVSQGYDGVRGIHHVRSTLYNKVITNTLKSILKRHEEKFKNVVNVAEVLEKVENVDEFDQHFTCKIEGYPNAIEYYRDHSCINLLSNIQVPFMLLNSLDDPLVPEFLIPYHAPFENENIILATTKHGGHLGWASGWLLPQKMHWHETLILEFTKAIIKLKKNKNN